MLGSCDVIAFAATTNPARAREFYEGVLGLRLVSDEPFALVFDAHGAMLRISKVQALSPAGHTILGWRVTDIAAAANELKTGGVTFEQYEGLEQDDMGVWAAPGRRQSRVVQRPGREHALAHTVLSAAAFERRRF